MKPQVLSSFEEMSVVGAQMVLEEVRNKPNLLICLATGGSPARLYDLLGESAARDASLFAQLRVLKLDEWGGLGESDPGSCEAYLQQKVVEPWRLRPEQFTGFDGTNPDSQAECARIRGWLDASGRIDVCVLGLGLNGHLGLNEPAESLTPFAHRTELSEEAQNHPMLADAPEKPEYGLTLGMADLLRARKILLLVGGTGKREAMRQMMQGPITTQFPASFLWLHPAVTCLCDREAASLLPSSG